jgi:hypothetical protein
MKSLPVEIRLHIFQISRQLSFLDRIRRFNEHHGQKILKREPRIDPASRCSPMVSRHYDETSGCRCYDYAFRCENCINEAVIYGTCTLVQLTQRDNGTILERSALGRTVGNWQPQEQCPGEMVPAAWFTDCRRLGW